MSGLEALLTWLRSLGPGVGEGGEGSEHGTEALAGRRAVSSTISVGTTQGSPFFAKGRPSIAKGPAYFARPRPSFAKRRSSFARGPRSFANGRPSFARGPRSFAKGRPSFAKGPGSFAKVVA